MTNVLRRLIGPSGYPVAQKVLAILQPRRRNARRQEMLGEPAEPRYTITTSASNSIFVCETYWLQEPQR